MSYPYHMALWDRMKRMAAQKKAQAERMAAVRAVMKKPQPQQARLV